VPNFLNSGWIGALISVGYPLLLLIEYIPLSDKKNKLLPYSWIELCDSHPIPPSVVNKSILYEIPEVALMSPDKVWILFLWKIYKTSFNGAIDVILSPNEDSTIAALSSSGKYSLPISDVAALYGKEYCTLLTFSRCPAITKQSWNVVIYLPFGGKLCFFIGSEKALKEVCIVAVVTSSVIV
jgi:hypothetical protein